MSSHQQSHSIDEPVLVSEAPKEAAEMSSSEECGSLVPSVSFSTTKTEIDYNVHSSPIHEIMLVSAAPKEEMSFYAEELGPSIIEHSGLESGLGPLHQSNVTVEESVHDPQSYMETSDTVGYGGASIDGSQRTNQNSTVDICFEAESESKAVAAGMSSRKCDTKDDCYSESDKLSEVECGVSKICLSKINYKNERILSGFKSVASSGDDCSSIVEECRMPFVKCNDSGSVLKSMESVTDIGDTVNGLFVDPSTIYDKPYSSFKWCEKSKSEHIHVPLPGISLEISDLQHVALNGEHFPSEVLEGSSIPSEHVENFETSVQRSVKSVESLQSCVSDMVLGSDSPSDLFRQEASKLSNAPHGIDSVSVADAFCYADEGQGNTYRGDQSMESNEASLRRSSRANKFTQKTPNRNHTGKGSKKALVRTIDLLPAAVRSRRSCLNRSARASDWGLLETLSKFIELNAVVDQRSGLVKGGNKSRKKDKVELGGVSHGSHANRSSTGHIRLKLKLVSRSKSIIEPSPLGGTDTQLLHLNGNGDKQLVLSSSIKDVSQELSQKYLECLSDVKLDRSATSEDNPRKSVLPVCKDLGSTPMSDKCSREGVGGRSSLDNNGEKSGISTDDRHLNSGTSPDSEVIQATGSQFPCDVLEGHHCGEMYSSKPTLTPKVNAVPIISKPKRKKGSKKETPCQLADSDVQNSLLSSSYTGKTDMLEKYCDNGPESDMAIRYDVGPEPTDSRNVKKLLPAAKAQRNRKSKSKLKPSSTPRLDLSKSGGVKSDKWKLAGKHGMDGRGDKTCTNTTGVTSEDVSSLPVVPGPQRAWVCCDDCLKWRSIPSNLVDIIDETDCRWTCKDNQDKAFADCSVPQEKSDAEINAELNISDVEEGHDVHLSGPQQSSWMLIKSNIFLHRRRKTQSLDEVWISTNYVLTNVMVCHCKATRGGKLGCDDECLNRMLNIECVQGTCPCGDFCANQQFQRQSYANLKWFRSGKKGYGLQVMEDITQGQFLIEYVGEVLELPAYEARLRVYASEGHKHFYFMTLNGNEVIDACGKGNLGRFINHSCDPNCRTEKWMVNGEICIGIFAVRNIKKGEELTFDYNYVRVFGAAAKKCYCGAAQCRGYIGGDRLNNETIVQGDSDEEYPEPVAIHENGEIADEYNMMFKVNTPDVMEEKDEDSLLQNGIRITSDDKDMINKLECSENDGLQDSVVGCSQGSDLLEVVGYMQEENIDKTTHDIQQEKSMGRSCSVSPKKSDNLSVNTLHPGFLSESVDTKLDRSSTKMAGGGAVLPKARPRMKISRPSKHVKCKESSDSSAIMDKHLVTTNKSQLTPNKLKKLVESSANHRSETVEGKLNELLDNIGGICKRKGRDAFKGYLKLLVLTAASGASNHQEAIQSNKDLSMILDAILKTKSRTVLTDILNKNGLQMLHSLMKKCRGNFNKIPILRKLLKIFEVLAERKVLTSEHINSEPPRPGMESFRDSVLSLTEYEDRKVHQIARSFRDRWIHRPLKKFKCMKNGERNMDLNGARSSGTHYQSSDQIERPSISGDCVKQSLQSNHLMDSDGLDGSPRFSVRGTRKRKSGWDQLPSDAVFHSTKELKTELTSSVIFDSDLQPWRRGEEINHSKTCSQESQPSHKDSEMHESEDDAPPGFSCPSFGSPHLSNITSSTVISISQQYPGPLKCPSEISVGSPQEIYNSALPISYGIPFNTVQEFGTPQSSTSDRWVIAPGMPFQPFPPLPSYSYQRWIRENPPSSVRGVERAGKSQERNSIDTPTDHGVPMISNFNTHSVNDRGPPLPGTRYFKQRHNNFRNPSWVNNENGGSRQNYSMSPSGVVLGTNVHDQSQQPENVNYGVKFAGNSF
ncbi:hypothetical protein V2J09_023754 [Rumex salicifolius]